MPARVVQFSGGIASWCVAQRVAARHGTDDLVLLFANTQIEDDDLYAFVHASAAQLAVPLVVVADGRTPWEVFEDKQIIGNSIFRTNAHCRLNGSIWWPKGALASEIAIASG